MQNFWFNDPQQLIRRTYPFFIETQTYLFLVLFDFAHNSPSLCKVECSTLCSAFLSPFSFSYSPDSSRDPLICSMRCDSSWGDCEATASTSPWKTRKFLASTRMLCEISAALYAEYVTTLLFNLYSDAPAVDILPWLRKETELSRAYMMTSYLVHCSRSLPSWLGRDLDATRIMWLCFKEVPQFVYRLDSLMRFR